jgi:ribosomal-protein-alanine N-acetyltransferase
MREPPCLTGPRVVVSLADLPDAAALRDFHERNFDRLKPWLPPPPDGFLTLAYWSAWTQAARSLHARDQSVRLAVRLRPAAATAIGAEDPAGADWTHRIIAQANLSNIQRGPFQAATLGYHIDGALEGRGLMHEALALTLDFAFGPLRLNRVMANYIPGNERSARLLARLGFTEEGYARNYLFIDGAWRDHVLTARLTPTPGDPTPPGAASGGTAGSRSRRFIPARLLDPLR